MKNSNSAEGRATDLLPSRVIPPGTGDPGSEAEHFSPSMRIPGSVFHPLMRMIDYRRRKLAEKDALGTNFKTANLRDEAKALIWVLHQFGIDYVTDLERPKKNLTNRDPRGPRIAEDIAASVKPMRVAFSRQTLSEIVALYRKGGPDAIEQIAGVYETSVPLVRAALTQAGYAVPMAYEDDKK